MNVFISYNSQNEDFADLVKMKLEKEGIQVWKDTSQIEAGTEWRHEIDQGLLNSNIVIVLLNQLATKSSYVTYEWAFALGNGKTIIPVLLEDCEIHPRMTVFQYLNFKGTNRPWINLIDRVKSVGKSNGVTRVGDLTVEELEKLINGSRGIASGYAKLEGRSVLDEDIAAVANKIVNAKTVFETQSIDNNTILWVDDRPDNNIYERESMELIGFKFDLALSTKDALKKLVSNRYVAIISDMGRVEGPNEGYVLLKEVRKTNKEIPYFIYAGSNLLEHKVQAQEKGAQGSTNIATELIDLVTSHVQPEKK